MAVAYCPHLWRGKPLFIRFYCKIWPVDSSCAELRPQPFFSFVVPLPFLSASACIFCLYHWAEHIPWPHLVPAWDVWLGIADLFQHSLSWKRQEEAFSGYRANSDDKECCPVLNLCQISFKNSAFEKCWLSWQFLSGLNLQPVFTLKYRSVWEYIFFASVAAWYINHDECRDQALFSLWQIDWDTSHKNWPYSTLFKLSRSANSTWNICFDVK